MIDIVQELSKVILYRWLEAIMSKAALSLHKKCKQGQPTRWQVTTSSTKITSSRRTSSQFSRAITLTIMIKTNRESEQRRQPIL